MLYLIICFFTTFGMIFFKIILLIFAPELFDSENETENTFGGLFSDEWLQSYEDMQEIQRKYDKGEIIILKKSKNVKDIIINLERVDYKLAKGKEGSFVHYGQCCELSGKGPIAVLPICLDPSDQQQMEELSKKFKKVIFNNELVDKLFIESDLKIDAISSENLKMQEEVNTTQLKNKEFITEVHRSDLQNNQEINLLINENSQIMEKIKQLGSTNQEIVHKLNQSTLLDSIKIRNMQIYDVTVNKKEFDAQILKLETNKIQIINELNYNPVINKKDEV